jgi:membrane dipeptidase
MNHNEPNTNTPATDPLSIHQRAIAIDMHADTVQRVLDEHVDIELQLSDGHFDAVRAKTGGLDAQFFSIWVEPQLFGGGGATSGNVDAGDFGCRHSSCRE